MTGTARSCTWRRTPSLRSSPPRSVGPKSDLSLRSNCDFLLIRSGVSRPPRCYGGGGHWMELNQTDTGSVCFLPSLRRHPGKPPAPTPRRHRAPHTVARTRQLGGWIPSAGSASARGEPAAGRRASLREEQGCHGGGGGACARRGLVTQLVGARPAAGPWAPGWSGSGWCGASRRCRCGAGRGRTIPTAGSRTGRFGRDAATTLSHPPSCPPLESPAHPPPEECWDPRTPPPRHSPRTLLRDPGSGGKGLKFKRGIQSGILP